MKITLLLCSSALLCLPLASCGGGDTQGVTSQPPPPPPPPPTMTKAVSLGTIESFSSSPSITAAPGATILIDGDVATSSELDFSEGEVLLASGELDSATNGHLASRGKLACAQADAKLRAPPRASGPDQEDESGSTTCDRAAAGTASHADGRP